MAGSQRIWTGNSVAVKQKSTWARTSSGTSGTLKMRVTGEDGQVTSVITAVTTIQNTSVIIANLTSNWNNTGAPVVQRVEATGTSNTITLTAKSAGEPFTATVAVAGSITFGTSTNPTTSNSGPNDIADKFNWQGETTPVTSDDITIPAGTPSLLYNLDQFKVVSHLTTVSTCSYKSFTVEEGYAGTIGGTDDSYFAITLRGGGRFIFAGTGQAWIDIGRSIVKPQIDDSYSPGSGEYGLSLKCTSLADLYVNKGNVGLGIEPADTTTRVTNIHVSYKDNQASDADVTLGRGVTASTVSQSGGNVTALCNVATLTMDSGTYTQLEDQITSSGTATLRGDSVMNVDTGDTTSGDPMGLITMADDATLNNTQTKTTKFIKTPITVRSEDCTINDPNGLFKTSGPVTANFQTVDFDQCGICTINIGKNKSVRIVDS
jgi:hypothetical protein